MAYTLIAFKPEHEVYVGDGDYVKLPATCVRETHETREQVVARIVELRTTRPVQEYRGDKVSDCVVEDVWVFSGEHEADITDDGHVAVDEWRRVNEPEAWARDKQRTREMQENNARVFARLRALGLIPRDVSVGVEANCPRPGDKIEGT